MTGSTAPNDGRDVSNRKAYLSRMSPEDRATYALTTGDADMEDDIRLLRTIIARLLDNVTLYHRQIAALLTVLCRAISLQLKSQVAPDEVELALIEAAEEVLQEMEGTAAGPEDTGE